MDVIEVHRWPSDDSIAQLVVIDHRRPLDQAAIRHSVESARARRPAAIRTGALFPDVAEAFAAEGFQVIDTLTLLTRELPRGDERARLRGARRAARGAGLRLARLGRRRLDQAAEVDRAAFGEEWGHRAESLARIANATPRTTQRVVLADRRLVGVAITGFGERRGYLQRLAVEPQHQRRGIGQLLVFDALEWLSRQGATSAMVNTGVDNTAALGLYTANGFRQVGDQLRVMELVVDG